MTTNNLPYKVVVAIDFGQNGSGYAYAFLDEKVPEYETTWPDQPRPYIKTRTALLYSPDRKIEEWGYSAFRRVAELRSAGGLIQGHSLCQNFKMHLRRGRRGRDGPVYKAHDDAPAFAVVDLVAAILAKLKEKALDRLVRATTGAVGEADVLWCLTVPAIWTDLEKRWMREAACRAGLIGRDAKDASRLCLVHEPEAAALYCQHRDAKTGLSRLTEGTRFLVVDAGGGTVDVTAHEVADGALDEVVPGLGGENGSHTINEKFRDHLRHYFGDATVKRLHTEQPLGWLRLMDNFEEQKQIFGPARFASNAPVFVEFPQELTAVLRKHDPAAYERLMKERTVSVVSLHLERPAMEAMFERALEDAVGLVRTQLDAMGPRGCDYLFLVGGFAASELLRQRFEKEFEQPGRVKKVVVPASPGTAVVLGAALYGCDPGRIASRRARYTYGCRLLVPFEHDVDPVGSRLNRPDGVWCRDRFWPYIRAGEKVEFNRRILHPIRATPRGRDYVTLQLYRSPDPNVRYTFEAGVEKVSEMVIHLPDAAKASKVAYEVAMYFGRTEIAVEAVCRSAPSLPPVVGTLDFSSCDGDAADGS